MIAGVGVAQAAVYATVSTVKGGALVLTNEGNVPAVDGLSLAEGDRLIVLEGGHATLKYADGCVHEISSNQVALLRGKSPCHGGTVETRSVGPTVAQSTGSGGTSLGWIPVVGGVIVVAAIAAGTSDDDNDGQPPLSP